MEKRQKQGISTFSSQFTSTVSVALVLLLLGIIALLGIGGRSVTTDIMENMGFDVVLTDDATDAEVSRVKRHFTHADYVSSVAYFSADDALARWQEETGEDLVALLGVNPFSGELEVKVTADYANTDSILRVTEAVRKLPGVAEVNIHTDLVDAINANIRSVALLLTVVAGAMLFISFVLINNTVRLTVYSRRFLIHTMKLVGAKGSFIRRPFVAASALSGLIAGVIASGLLAGALAYLHEADGAVIEAVPWTMALPVMGVIVVAGVVISALAATLATNKYLRLDYDEMFN